MRLSSAFEVTRNDLGDAFAGMGGWSGQLEAALGELTRGFDRFASIGLVLGALRNTHHRSKAKTVSHAYIILFVVSPLEWPDYVGL